MKRILVAITFVLLQLCRLDPARAFEREHGVVELGVLAGATFFLADKDDVNYTGYLTSGAGGIHAPITPALRLTFWTDTPVLIDVGASWFSSNVFDESFTALNFEVGLGLRTTYPSRVVPWTSVLAGFVSWSANGTTNDAYVGAQAGVRAFVTGRTSFRAQLGYRHTIENTDSGFDIDAVETSIGLGVYL